jgi:AcrR family transcriptional regulator
MASQQSLKERQRQEREDLILHAAQEVLLERGYHDMSMGEIAARVGVAKGTLYQHFPSKECLMQALFKQGLQELQGMVEQTVMMQGDALVKLTFVIEQICMHLSSKHVYHIYMFYALHANPELHTAFTNEIKDIYLSVCSRIIALLEEGKAEAVFTRRIPTIVMLEALFGLLSPRTLLVQRGLLVEPEDLVDYLGSIYLRGIAAADDEDRAAYDCSVC